MDIIDIIKILGPNFPITYKSFFYRIVRRDFSNDIKTELIKLEPINIKAYNDFVNIFRHSKSLLGEYPHISYTVLLTEASNLLKLAKIGINLEESVDNTNFKFTLSKRSTDKNLFLLAPKSGIFSRPDINIKLSLDRTSYLNLIFFFSIYRSFSLLD